MFSSEPCSDCSALYYSAYDHSAAGAATPLHKVVFVFAGFNERTGYIFVAKDLRFFEEQGLDAQIVQVRNVRWRFPRSPRMKRSFTPSRRLARAWCHGRRTRSRLYRGDR